MAAGWRGPAPPARPAPRRRSGAPRPGRRPSPALGWLERLHLRELGVEVRGEAVGDLEDAGVGPPVDGQGVGGDVGAPSAAGKSSAEAEDVGDRRAAPAVDRLVGVTDGGDRVAAPALGRGTGEEREDRACATEVSWYSSSSTTRYLARSPPPDLGMVAGQPRGQGDLVGEVHQPEPRLQPPVPPDEAEHLPRSRSASSPSRGRPRARAVAELRLEQPGPAWKARDLLRRDEVLAHRALEPRAGSRTRAPGSR